jgi:hypothetical protein
MTERQTFIRVGGWLGIFSGLAILISSLTTAITSSFARPEDPSEVGEFLAEVGSNGNFFHVYGWLGLIGLVLAVPFTYGLFLLVRGVLTEAWLGAVFMVAGLIVLFPAYVLAMLTATSLAPLFDDLGASAADSIYVVFKSLSGMATLLFLFGSLLTFSIAPWLLSTAWLKTATSPRWIGWLGVFAGVTGLAWAGLLLDEPGILQLVWAINAFANIIWIIAVGATMARNEPSDEVTAHP